MVAWAMNGADRPFLNGYPLRLVVPGHYGTYWIKHLHEINVVDAAYDGYWMKTAYRIPDNDCACVAPGGKPDRTRPIGRLNIRRSEERRVGQAWVSTCRSRRSRDH